MRIFVPLALDSYLFVFVLWGDDGNGSIRRVRWVRILLSKSPATAHRASVLQLFAGIHCFGKLVVIFSGQTVPCIYYE